jgi:hypothetical protein
MHAIDKYWQPDKHDSHQQNLYGTVDLKFEEPEKALIASYWPTPQGWEWRIYLYNNTPDMQEHGFCRTEEEARQAINYFIGLA